MAVIYYSSPFGILEVTGNGSQLLSVKGVFERREDEPDQITEIAVKQLQEYFVGSRREFSVPFMISGTAFQKKVYEAILKIPYGETVSYKQLGEMIGLKKGYQAIGNALHKNPLLIIVPCHRVIKTDGSYGGYVLGEEIKKYLLSMESTK